MKKTAKYIVFREKETGAFLANYKSRGSLAYEANYADDIQHAAALSLEAFEKQKESVEALAKGLDCEVLIVEGTYRFTQLDGEDAKEIEQSDKAKAQEALRSLLNMLGE